MSTKSNKVYVGWDGSFVFSKTKLKKTLDKQNGNYYLAPAAKGAKCIDVADALIAFSWLKLEMWQVVRLDVKVVKL